MNLIVEFVKRYPRTLIVKHLIEREDVVISTGAGEISELDTAVSNCIPAGSYLALREEALRTLLRFLSLLHTDLLLRSSKARGELG